MDSTMVREITAQCSAEEAYVESCRSECREEEKMEYAVDYTTLDGSYYWKMANGDIRLVRDGHLQEWLREKYYSEVEWRWSDKSKTMSASRGRSKPTNWKPNLKEVGRRTMGKHKVDALVFRVYGVSTDIGMLKCGNGNCISNTARKELKALGSKFGLLDSETGYVGYPSVKIMLDTAIRKLKASGRFIPFEELKVKVSRYQKEIFKLRKFVLDTGYLMKHSGNMGYLQEVVDKEDTKLVCPYCGSTKPIMAWTNHIIEMDLDADLEKDSKMDPEYRASEWLEEQEIINYRKELLV